MSSQMGQHVISDVGEDNKELLSMFDDWITFLCLSSKSLKSLAFMESRADVEALQMQ